ncbi:hypothetical protein L873DRAFT_750917 [Choiromyces venosus 120613-1]|uniref:Secreted protein n=1 Tax=Choiromyces venosus 120613-1 TaxID=1336337 RepID=A0A3N4JRE7_9PEZI|nr:hypothetical protein L873DRAFT_750917 [Choiromyces venosus 120613-1]
MIPILLTLFLLLLLAPPPRSSSSLLLLLFLSRRRLLTRSRHSPSLPYLSFPHHDNPFFSSFLPRSFLHFTSIIRWVMRGCKHRKGRTKVAEHLDAAT